MYNIQKIEELKAIAEVNAMNTHAENALRQLQSFTQQAYDAFWNGETSPSLKVTLLQTLSGGPSGSSSMGGSHITSVCVNHSTIAPVLGDALFGIVRSKTVINALI
jgi:hypothetical protein